MPALRRELLWAAAIVAQLLVLATLFPIASFLQQGGWLGHWLRSIGDLVLLPLLVSLALLPSVLTSMVMVWLWLLFSRARQRPPRAVVLAHFAGAFLGAFGMFLLLGRVGSDEPGRALIALVWATPLALLAFVLVHWPRRAFRALRISAAGTDAPARAGPPRS